MPVLADGGSEAGSVRRKAGDVETPFSGSLAFEEAGGFDYGEGFQVGPTFGAGQTVELLEGVTTAMFDAVMVFFECFVENVRGLLRGVLEQGKEVAQGVTQVRLVVLHRQHAVGAPRSRIARAIEGWASMASMVTMQPSNASTESNGGIEDADEESRSWEGSR
jgi:hypothetical protein